MLKPCLLLFLVGSSACFHVSKLIANMTLIEGNLPPNTPLQVSGVKKISRALVEHVILRNCSGVIDEATFRHFPKLSELLIWKSNITKISSILPIISLTVSNSRLPNLDSSLQEKLPKLRSLMLLGNKDFQVDPLVFKNFNYLQSLSISEAKFTENCVTKDWFKGMADLQALGLSDNGIDCIAEDAFNSLRSLRKLDLTYNRIPKIEQKLFKKLTKLEQLGLYENDLQVMDIQSLGSQGGHLELLGISWHVLKSSGISAQDVLKTLPKLKSVSFGHEEMPDDFKAGEFCQILKQNGTSCIVDSDLGVSVILGF